MTFLASLASSTVAYSTNIFPRPGTIRPIMGLGILRERIRPNLEHSSLTSMRRSSYSSSISSFYRLNFRCNFLKKAKINADERFNKSKKITSCIESMFLRTRTFVGS